MQFLCIKAQLFTDPQFAMKDYKCTKPIFRRSKKTFWPIRTGQLQPNIISKRIELESWDYSQIQDIFLQIIDSKVRIFNGKYEKAIFQIKGKNQFKFAKIGCFTHVSIIAISNHFYFWILQSLSSIQDQSQLSSSIRLEMTWD